MSSFGAEDPSPGSTRATTAFLFSRPEGPHDRADRTRGPALVLGRGILGPPRLVGLVGPVSRAVGLDQQHLGGVPRRGRRGVQGGVRAEQFRVHFLVKMRELPADLGVATYQRR